MSKETNCPICKRKVDSYYEVSFKEPFVHNIPYEGLVIYGAYSSPKETICYENNYLHFAFYDAKGNLSDHRLVKLGVENPETASYYDEFINQPMEEPDDLPF